MTSIALTSSSGLTVGQAVTDTTTPANITAGTYITGISGNTIFVNQATPTTAAAQTLAFGNSTVTTAQTINNVTVSASSTVDVQPNSGSGTTLTFGTLTGSGNLTKTGASPLQINGANSTFTGDTILSTRGVVQLLSQNALQASTANATGTGTLVFDSSVAGNAFTLGGLKGSTSQSLVNNAGSPAPIALTVGANNQSTTYGGVLGDSGLGGSLIKAGTGTFTLTGGNTYTGSTQVQAGILYLNGANGGTSTAGQASYSHRCQCRPPRWRHQRQQQDLPGQRPRYDGEWNPGRRRCRDRGRQSDRDRQFGNGCLGAHPRQPEQPVGYLGQQRLAGPADGERFEPGTSRPRRRAQRPTGTPVGTLALFTSAIYSGVRPRYHRQRHGRHINRRVRQRDPERRCPQRHVQPEQHTGHRQRCRLGLL